MNKKLNTILKQIGLQLFLLSITAMVLFPVMWMVSIASGDDFALVDPPPPEGVGRPADSLR